MVTVTKPVVPTITIADLNGRQHRENRERTVKLCKEFINHNIPVVVTVEQDATTIVFNGGDNTGQMIDFCCLVDRSKVDYVGKPTVTTVFKRVLDRRLPLEIKVVFDNKSLTNPWRVAAESLALSTPSGVDMRIALNHVSLVVDPSVIWSLGMKDAEAYRDFFKKVVPDGCDAGAHVEQSTHSAVFLKWLWSMLLTYCDIRWGYFTPTRGMSVEQENRALQFINRFGGLVLHTDKDDWLIIGCKTLLGRILNDVKHEWFDKCVESFVVTEDGSIADDDEDDESHY